MRRGALLQLGLFAVIAFVIVGVVALYPSWLPPQASERALLDRLGMPVVTVGNRQPGWPSVRIDDRAAMAMATGYVIGLGHTETFA